MASGTPKTPVALTDASVTVSGYDKNKAGEQTIKVEYEGKTKTFTVEVVDEVQSITMKDTPKARCNRRNNRSNKKEWNKR